LAIAEIPDSAKNTQSTVIHALSLVCSLLMISSLALNGPATTVSPIAVKGGLTAFLQENDDYTSTNKGQLWKTGCVND
jgi:hypothetical protein